MGGGRPRWWARRQTIQQTRKKDNQTFYRGGLKRQTKGTRMSHIEHTKLKGKPKQVYVLVNVTVVCHFNLLSFCVLIFSFQALAQSFSLSLWFLVINKKSGPQGISSVFFGLPTLWLTTKETIGVFKGLRFRTLSRPCEISLNCYKQNYDK